MALTAEGTNRRYTPPPMKHGRSYAVTLAESMSVTSRMTSISDIPGGMPIPSVLTDDGMSEKSSSTLPMPSLFNILSSVMSLGHYSATRIFILTEADIGTQTFRG